MKNLKLVLNFHTFSIFNFPFSIFKSGQSLIEILIAMALVTILLPAILTGLVASREGKAQEDQRLTATALLRESEEVVRSVREKGWEHITSPGIYHPGTEYRISICPFSGCSVSPPIPPFTSYTGQADNSGNLNAVFSPTTNQAAFEVWITRTPGSLCSGLGCFAVGKIDSISFSGLTDGINYTISVCSQQNCISGQNYSQFNGQSTSGVLDATFAYAPSFTGAAVFEVWIQQPPPPGCSGLACFGFTFANINALTISGLDSSQVWSLAPGAETISGFTRQIEISNVNRDSSGNVVPSGGNPDPSTKRIVATVSWTTPVASSVESTFYLSRHLENTTWVQTSDIHFNAGTHNGTRTVGTGNAASVELDPTSSTGVEYGNQFLVDSVGPMVWLITPGIRNNIRFTAQNSKTVDRIRIYVHNIVGTSPTYRVGIQSDVSNNPSGTFLGSATFQPTSTGWYSINISNAAIVSGGTYHIVVQYETGSIGFGNYIQLRQSTPLNRLYPFDNKVDLEANTGYFSGSSWQYSNNQPIYALEFTDSSFEGNPYETGDEFQTYGSIVHGEQFTVPNAITVSDINWLVRKRVAQNPQGPLKVILQNITTATTLADANIVTSGTVSQTYQYYKYTFNPPIQLLPGNTYRVYVSAPNVSEARAYMIKRVQNSTAQELNSINFDGVNSIYYVTGYGAIPYWDAAGWFFTVQSGGSGSGTFTSQIFDAEQEVAFNNITWSETLPNPNTNIQLQISVDNAPFMGPTGTTSFYDSPGAIPLNSTLGQRIQFRANLSGPGAVTPTLHDVSINYSP